MRPYVDIRFECYPLRSIARIDAPIDATPEYRALCKRVRQAMEKHGRHNTHYLCNARCVFHLTNQPHVGMLEFHFEGVVLTDEQDRQARTSTLDVRLARETCSWLSEPVVRWFQETVHRAVEVEFNRYVDAGDLDRTKQRIEQLEAASDAMDGFLGMYL